MKHPEDILDWHLIAKQIDEIGGFTGVEKSRIKRAIEYLADILGEDFLREAVLLPSHPLLWLVTNFAPWTRRELTRLAESLKTLEGCDNFEQLIKRLKRPKTFVHEQLVIECSAKLAREGLRPSFEPTLPTGDNQKQPDVRLENCETRENLFLEVSIQQSSRGQTEATAAMDALTSNLFRLGAQFQWAGRLQKTPAPLHLNEIVTKAESALRQAQMEQSFVEVSEEGTFEIAFCPTQQAELLVEWGAKRNLKVGQFEGPPFDENLVGRLKRKIEKEQRQLQADSSNILFIFDTDIFFRSKSIREVINELEEEVFKYPKMSMAVIYGSSLVGASPEVLQKGEHRYVRRVVDGMLTEDSILLINRYSPTTISTNTLAKFLRAF